MQPPPPPRCPFTRPSTPPPDEIVRHRLVRSLAYMILLTPVSYCCQQLVGYQRQDNQFAFDPDAGSGWLLMMTGAMFLGIVPRRLRPWLWVGIVMALCCHTGWLLLGGPCGLAADMVLMGVLLFPATLAQRDYEKRGGQPL